MAQLKDSVVLGSLRVTDTLFGTTGQFTKLNIPIASGGTTYGPGSNGNVLKSNGTTVYWASDSQGVTSVQVQATSPVLSSTATAQNSTLNTTISLADGYGDTKNPYGSKTKNYVLAASATANSAPSFRALVAADLPAGSTSAAGILQLSDATNSTSTSLAATANAVKTAYDLAASKTSLTIGTTATTAAAGNHTHGNLTNDGKITSTATIANGDKLVIVDSYTTAASKITGSSITFDGSTATKALTQKGTWETFNNYSHPTGDGNLHVPATSTTNNGKFLQAGSTAGSLSWASLPTASDSVAGITTVGASGGAAAYDHTHSYALTAITGTDDLQAIEALTGTSGFLKKTAANTWALDTTVLTSASSLSASKLTGTVPSGCYTNSRDPGYGQITPANNASTVTALTGNTTPAVATNYSEGIKFTGANKWIVLAGSNSSTAGSDEIKFAHHVPSSISNTGPTSAQTPGYNATFNIPVISVDEAGHVTGISTTTVKIPATDNTNNAATHTLATTTKYYVTGTTSAATSTAGDSFDTGVYVTANAGELSALKYSVHDTSSTPVEKVQLVWNSTDSTLDFVFA